MAAYRAMWKDLEVASLTADPASARLDDHATGAALRLLKYGLAQDHRNGLITKGTVTLDPNVESASPTSAPTEAKIFDCSDDSHWLQYKSDGTLKDVVPGGHFATKATVRRFGAAWKVAELAMGEDGSC